MKENDMAIGPTQALQQTLSLFEEVSDSRTAKKIKDSHTVATRLQDVFDKAKKDKTLPEDSIDIQDSERLCEELKSKRFVFFYDSRKVRFGHGLWRFISMPFCNYVDVSKFQTYSKLLDIIKQAVEPHTATIPGGFPAEEDAAKQVAEYRQTVKSLSTHNGQLQGENEQLKGELTQASQRIAELEEQVRQNQAEIDLKKKDYTSLERQLATLRVQLQEATDRLEVEKKALKEQAPGSQQAAAPVGAALQATPTRPAQGQGNVEHLQQQIATLKEQFATANREKAKSEASNTQLTEERDRLTRTLAEKEVAREEATAQLSLLSHQHIKTLHDILQAAFPPLKWWGGSETIRFREPQQGTPTPPAPKGFWVFHETSDDMGKTSVSYDNGRGEKPWDPAEIELPKLVDLVKKTRGIQGVIWIRGTPAGTN